MPGFEVRFCRSADGVRIAYQAGGAGEPALVFIHGALTTHEVWARQLEAFAASHRVLAPDLAGHGQSGGDRSTWSLGAFAADVRSVVDAERAGRAILIGNSLGGAVALEAAVLMPDKAIGIVGVDTFQDLGGRFPAEAMRRRAALFRDDFGGTVARMLESLFHPDTDPAVVTTIERQMKAGFPEVIAGLFETLADYDQGATVGRLRLPIRSINGDIYPTDLDAIRKVAPGFDAVVMPHTSHFPMLERPEEFNRLLGRTVEHFVEPAGM